MPHQSLLTRDGLLGGAGVVDESGDFAVILLPRCGFHPARDIEAEWPDVSDRRRDVLGIQTTSQDHRSALEFGRDGQIPVEAVAGAAVTAGHMAVEQPCVGVGKTPHHAQAVSAFNAKGFPHAQWSEARAELRQFLAVKLQGVDAGGGNDFAHLGLGGIHKDPDLRHPSGKLVDDLPRNRRFDEPFARAVEHEPERIGTRRDGRERVGEVRDATDFDEQSHGREGVDRVAG